MRTDDRTTRQRDEAEGGEAKVVRLSDWLAPDDELVPFGPRAHAPTGTRGPAERRPDPDSDAEPPAASGFWDGDTSLHAAVPGPGFFDDHGERTADRRRLRRPAPVWRPSPPPLHPFGWGSRTREWLTDLGDRISWPWAAGGLAIVAVALIALVVTLGDSSSGHRKAAARAGIGAPSRPTLNSTLSEIGTAARAAAVADLLRLPSVNAAVRTIGAATDRAGALEARQRRHAVLAHASVSSSSTTGSLATPTTPESTPAPAETEPAQTPPPPTPTGGGGGGESTTSGGGSTASSANSTSPYGPTGALGPGSSPDS